MLKQRASKKMIFLLVLICISTFITTPTYVRAEEPVSGAAGNIGDKAFIINSDWLAVSVDEFNGQPLDYTGKLGRLNIDVGGYGMTNFVNHGEIAFDAETETHVYMAEMNFPVSVVIYTDAMIDDVYPDHYTGTGDEEWLALKTFRTWFFSYYQGDINYNTYDVTYSNIYTGAIDTHEYDGNLRLKAIISPDLPIEEGGTITINGAAFKVPNIRVFIESVDLIERTYGVADDPQNFYTDNDGVIEVRKEDLMSLDFSSGSSGAKSQAGDGLDGNHATPYEGRTTARDKIRWAGVHNRVRYYGVTYTAGQVGQAYASSPTVGSTWSRSDDLNDYDEVFEFDSHIRIKPNIFYDMERFDVRHTYLYVDRYKESFLPEYGLCDIKDEYVKTKTRIIGLGVQNIFIKMKFNFKVTMLLAVQPTSEEGEKILEDPEVYQGDIIWDNSIGGITDAKASVAEPRTWATDIADSWDKFWSDTGAWIDDQLDWLKGMSEDMADNWYDWWDNLPNALMDWIKQFWWVILLGIAIVVIILGFYLFYPRLAKGTVKAYKEHKEPTQRQPRYKESKPQKY